MKFKSISKFLTIGILLNSFNSTSFAGILSEDGRYETFKDSSISIDNILEEDKVDIEIEGNTLVNYVNLEEFYSNGDKNAVTINSNSVVIENPSTWTKAYYYFNLKPNTIYTLKVDGNNLMDIHASSYIRFCHDINSKDVIRATLFDSGEKAIKTKVFTTNDSGEVCLSLESPSANGVITYSNVMLLEGDWTDKEIPDYFKGVKSVGESDSKNHELKITSTNGNLYDYTKYVPSTHQTGVINSYVDGVGDFNSGIQNGAFVLNFSKDEFDTTKDLYFSINITELSHDRRYGIFCREKSFGKVYGSFHYIENPGIYTFKVPANTIDNDFMFLVYAPDINSADENIKFKDITISYKNMGVLKHKSSKVDISLKEPLRALPNGVADKIIKKDGQWFIERKCKEIILVGSEDEKWGIGNGTADVEGNTTLSFQRTFQDIAFGREVGINLICDKFPVYDYATASTISEDKEWIRHYSTTSGNVGIKILKSKLPSEDIAGFKKWLSENPVSIIYELAEPIYEPLNINLSANLYLDTTYISTNSTIPANIKVTVDRVLNRAVEAIELAKTTPSVENIAIARMWTNLARESIKKDELQDLIDSIIEIKDLEIEKQTVSANVDLYIKSLNTLSMSLSTNSITFEDYSLVEDMEKLSAVEINISSSLPYSLNAYLETPITNSDNTSTIEPNILNIKESSNSSYQAFKNVSEKIILNDDCESGNDNLHNIDIKLAKDTMNKADVYKATIKFEAIQK